MGAGGGLCVKGRQRVHARAIDVKSYPEAVMIEGCELSMRAFSQDVGVDLISSQAV